MADPSLERAKDGAYELMEGCEAAFEAGEIDEAEWHRRIAAVITPAYLAAGNPRAQSGHSGDDAAWEYSRGLVADAIERDGTFLDIGCASGYLMETVQRWAGARGLNVDPYGLDIAPELAELARRRLPHWAERIFVGNALGWLPPMRFHYVRTGLEYVPCRRRRDLVEHLLTRVVAPGGRLVVGKYNEEKEALLTGPSLEAQVAGWGYRIAGRSARAGRDSRLLYRVFWVDAA